MGDRVSDDELLEAARLLHAVGVQPSASELALLATTLAQLRPAGRRHGAPLADPAPDPEGSEPYVAPAISLQVPLQGGSWT
jgi:hypothetical protein